MSPHPYTYGCTEIHKYKADTHTFHPTCSVNREQDVADIWVHEQTRDAPRKREIQRKGESREEGTDEREGERKGERGVGGQMKW